MNPRLPAAKLRGSFKSIGGSVKKNMFVLGVGLLTVANVFIAVLWT